MLFKRCPNCEETLSTELFYKNSNNKTGYSSWCRACWQKIKPTQQEKNLKYKYGFSPNEFAEMLSAQNGCCAICGIGQNEADRTFSVDHNHETNRVRGLLCTKCNTGIGMLQDSYELLIRAAEYIKENK